MQRFQSPTLLRLILVGFLIVALPLVAAIITAIVQVDGLAKTSRAAVAAVQMNIGATRLLTDRITELERTARLYEALGDDEYKSLYEHHRREVLVTLAGLSTGSTDARVRMPIETARRLEIVANDYVEAIGAGTTPADLVAAFAALRDAVISLARAQNVVAREMANSLPEHARRLQRLLVGQAALVIPLSVGLGVLFGVLISRPLRQLHQGIRGLGRGALSEPLNVTGTRDFEELGERLEWLRARLVALEAQKAQFLRNVSHELKTPLTKIREGAELLAEADETPDVAVTDPERATILRIVRDNSIRLQRMIEELLRFGADSDVGPKQANERVQMDAVVRDVVEQHAPTAAAQAVTLDADVQPVVVRGSARKLHVIVDNLLSNAVRHTPRGGRVRIALRGRGGAATLDVRDSGPGVSGEDEPHVFEWFYTGPRPEGSVVAGTGMGLAISQEYAQQHGGHVELLASAEGAHFRLTLGTNRGGGNA